MSETTGNGGENGGQNGGQQQQQAAPPQQQQQAPPPNPPVTHSSTNYQQHNGSPGNAGGSWQFVPTPADPIGQLSTAIAALPETVSRAVRESFPNPPQGSAAQPANTGGNVGGEQQQSTGGQAQGTGQSQSNAASNDGGGSGNNGEPRPQSQYRNAFQRWWFEG